MAAEPRQLRITLVADELLGYIRTGGIGTASTHLAIALGRMGHRVEFLYSGPPPTSAMASQWAQLYDAAGVRIRMLPRSDTQVEPGYFAQPRDVERALASDPPDVVIAQDLAAPAYAALRLRQLGLTFPDTLFVLYCHGGRRWITDMARKVRVLPGAHAVTLLEQACVELADTVVSPSEYLLDWMRGQHWRLPEHSVVIPHFSRSAITGERPPQAEDNGGPVERIAFFGRLEERKGLRPFAAGVNALDPQLLRNVEIEFVGAATAAWPPARVAALLSETARSALRRISFQTALDQPEALERLSRPGTLAVMPSHGETFSNAVYECLERGIPFLAADAGAPAELIAAEDRGRVLFEPTPAGVGAALQRALTNGDALRPARAAFDAQTPFERWAKVLALRPQPRPPKRRPRPDVVRGDTVRDASSEWVVLIDDGDIPDDELADRLAHAQSVSGADVVTCGARLASGAERLFLGDPGGLGLLGNHYGTTALIRRSLLPAELHDSWTLLARLSLEGAKIVSVPRALVTLTKPPGDVDGDPAAALRVVDAFERQLPSPLRSLARLAAGLSAASHAPPRPRTPLRRLLRR